MVKKLRESLARPIEPEKLSFGRIFAVQAVLFLTIYGIMLIPRFSTDSYSVYFYTSDGLNGFLELGRIGTFLRYKALLAFGINSVTLSPLFTAVLCLAVTWSAAVVLHLLKLCFPSLNRLTALLLEFAVILVYGNIYFAELFFFSDVALMYVFTIVFMTLALILVTLARCWWPASCWCSRLIWWQTASECRPGLSSLFLPCSRLWLSSQAITMSAMENRSRWLFWSSCWSCSPPTSW